MSVKKTFLDTSKKEDCYGCEACAQVCPKKCISIIEDEEGFRYPLIEKDRCINCNACRSVCPFIKETANDKPIYYAFGGYVLDDAIRYNSTSGGAFSAIVNAFCDVDYVLFGAESIGLDVRHSFITDTRDLHRFRKSKYSQSRIGDSYEKAKAFLKEGKKVLFSGTPCQIAGLKNYLGNISQDLLLTVEVICEGVPSPLYMDKLRDHVERKNHSKMLTIDYRHKGVGVWHKSKWDFQVMEIMFSNNKTVRKDRWFNPFWSVWLQHLMSRPSCYECKFAQKERSADITLGDLWGVHIYCPELYGDNGGASLVICNTTKGRSVFEKAKPYMYGHELEYDEAIKYQSPLRKHIDPNPNRDLFMRDLKGNASYDEINKKWAKKPTLKLLWQKYIWGNRQKVALWKTLHKKGVKK